MSRQTQAPTTPRWNRRALIERLRSFVVERGKIASGSDIVTACNNSVLRLSDLRALLAALEAVERDIALIDPTTVSAQLVEWSERNLTEDDTNA